MCFQVAIYLDDEYLDAEFFPTYEDALAVAYEWQSIDPDNHISRIFEVDDDMNYTEVDL